MCASVAQSVEASDLKSLCYGFESHRRHRTTKPLPSHQLATEGVSRFHKDHFIGSFWALTHASSPILVRPGDPIYFPASHKPSRFGGPPPHISQILQR